MGDSLKRLYDRLNEDPSRYRAKDSQGNSIPFEIYQSDDTRSKRQGPSASFRLRPGSRLVAPPSRQ